MKTSTMLLVGAAVAAGYYFFVYKPGTATPPGGSVGKFGADPAGYLGWSTTPPTTLAAPNPYSVSSPTTTPTPSTVNRAFGPVAQAPFTSKQAAMGGVNYSMYAVAGR